MPSKYRQLKEAIGLSSPDSDNGKLARLKDELKTTWADKVDKASPIDRPALREIHRKAQQLVKAKDLAGASVEVSKLKTRLDNPNVPQPKVQRDYDVDGPMLYDREALKFDPENLEGWQRKVSKCEAFLQKYRDYEYPNNKTKADYSKECCEVEGMLAQARPELRKHIELKNLDSISMQTALQALKAPQPKEPEALKVIIAVCEAFLDKYRTQKKECAEVEGILADTRKQLTVSEANVGYAQQVTIQGVEFDLAPKERDMVRNGLPDVMKKKVVTDAGLTEAEVMAMRIFTCKDYKYINPAIANQKDKADKKGDPFMESQLKNVGIERKVSKLTDETERQKEQAQFDKEYEDRIKDIREKGALHAGMMAKAFAKLPKMKGKLYRGARMTPSHFKSTYQQGKEFPLESFQSNTKDLEVARTFARGDGDPANTRPADDQTTIVLVEIDAENAVDISELSVTNEKECVLPPDAKVVVTAIQDDPDRQQTAFFKNLPPATAWKKVLMKQIVS